MGLTFEVKKLDVPDNSTDIPGTIKTWLNNLAIPTGHTVYEISIEHYAGFWHCIAIYEP